MIVPNGVSTCRSKSAKGEWVEKVFDYVLACSSLKGKISQMKVVEDFESRPHEAVSFVVDRGKEIQEWNEQKLPKVLPGYSGGMLPGRSTKEKGRERGKVAEDGEERRIRVNIVQEVVAGIKEKVSVHDGEIDEVKRPVEQSFMRSSDCSQIENEEEESWREWDQIAAQWNEEQNNGGYFGMKEDGSSLQLEVMQNVPELFVRERMSRGTGVKGFKEKKKVSGWSMEETKEKLNIAVEEDTEEMKKWRGLSQSEMDQSWNNFG